MSSNGSSTMFYSKSSKNPSCITSPTNILKEKSLNWAIPSESLEFAKRLDEEDSLAHFQKLFCYPKKKDLPYIDPNNVNNDEECLYLCGQSLGLKPKSTDKYCKQVLENWGKRGVHSHFNGYLPAALCDLPPKTPMAKLVGALPNEVAIMNGLSVNLHLLLATFYRPSERRHKIMIEEHAFSSDMYAVKSQLILHGYSPETSLVLMKPRMGEYLLREDDIINIIEEEGDSIAVALFPGIQYYTGQFMNIEKLTKSAHSKGIKVGVDAAHAAGNVPLYLHDWNVDFAAWCTYKYLNAGPGCVGAIFVHERLTEKGGNSQFPMLKGWWGNNMKTKFLMKDDFDPSAGADMFRLSNPPALLSASLMASLDIFSQTSMEELRQKQILLTGYLEYLLREYFSPNSQSKIYNPCQCYGQEQMPTVDIITPTDPARRGSQLSIIFSVPLSAVQDELQKRGIVCDIRMPNVMRVAPTALYNSYTHVYNFVNTLRQIFDELEGKFEHKCEPVAMETHSHDFSLKNGHTAMGNGAPSDSEQDLRNGTNGL